jgi:serine/threonine-protein kinase
MKLRLVVGSRVRGWLRRFGAGAAWLAVACALAGGAFTGAFLLAMKSTMRSTEVTVPELRPLSLDAATTAVAPLELRLEVVDRRHDPAVASGGVLQQDPPAGASVRRGRKIKLVVSLGGRVLEVPDLLARPDRTVEIELTRAGFAAGDEARVHSTAAGPGRVIAQVPAPGSPTVPNARVHRLISRGERDEVWVMPDLTGLSRTAAERWIEACGLRVGPVRRVPGRGRSSGTVAGQLPLAGYPVRSREVVELGVAD